MSDWWMTLDPDVQDALWLVLLALPAVVVGLGVTLGYRPFSLIAALLWRFRWTNLLLVTLIAVSVGIGVGLTAQERGLRRGTALAAEKFDLVVGAPGSEVTLMLAAVYLQPSDVPLIDGDVYAEIEANPKVSLAAPIAFGDSYEGAPVVGTTQGFVDHLAGAPVEGRVFQARDEAVVGAKAPLAVGEHFVPAHGAGPEADGEAHAGMEYRVVGRLAPTGSPWDRAVLVPVESVWAVHGLAMGHAPESLDQLGPPFDPAYFPGTPAVLVRAEELWANYALKSEFTRADTMAFFPGTVLSQLHALLGDVREIMSVLALVTQILVTAGVLSALVILSRLFARRLALLRALGAPARFVFALIWGYAASLIGLGALAGYGVGIGAAAVISKVVSARTDILVTASPGWTEAHLVAAFVSLTILLALVPAALATRRSVVADLRGG